MSGWACWGAQGVRVRADGCAGCVARSGRVGGRELGARERQVSGSGARRAGRAGVQARGAWSTQAGERQGATAGAGARGLGVAGHWARGLGAPGVLAGPVGGSCTRLDFQTGFSTRYFSLVTK